MRISDIDKNFTVQSLAGHDVVFQAVNQPPFVLEGLPFKDTVCDGAPYCRVSDEDMAAIVPEHECPGIPSLRRCLAGAAIRFRAKTPYLAIRATTRESYDGNHMPRSGADGFDVYRKRPGEDNWTFCSGCQPNPPDANMVIAIEQMFPATWGYWCNDECDYLINLPLYGGVSSLEIGFSPDAVIMPPTPHKIAKPVCFYGSSITQGGCASRPGNNYCSHLCRAVDAEQINLGFSGNARGGKAVAAMLNKLDLSCLVLDYDHNAPSLEHLQSTHEELFKLIRAAHPDLPIILVSKPDVPHSHNGGDYNNNAARRDVIKATYEHAIAAGDKKVWFVDGFTLFGTEDTDTCTVDGCHPNDLGFYRMYRTILPVLQEALK